jgi:DNA replication protein
MNDQFIKKLIESKVINIKDFIINHYPKLGLDEKGAMLLIHIYNLSESGQDFLSINHLTDKMAIEFVDCADLVFKLVQKNFIAFDIHVDDQGKTKEKYTLDPLFQKILTLLIQENKTMTKVQDEHEIAGLIRIIEQEFGRPLSSFEIQMITAWINESKYSIALIKLAIKEALLSNAYNLKYVDRILLNWQQKNITEVQQAQEYTKTFKRFETKQAQTSEQEVYVSWMK